MANVLFGWPIYSDPGVLYSPTLSGGSWSATLPLSNLQDPLIAKPARSTNALAASTTFDVDLKVARPIRLIALVGVNLTSAASLTVYIDDEATIAAPRLWDSGVIAGASWYPTGHDAETLEGLNLTFLHLPVATTGRYVRISISDAANPAGYIQIGRLVIAGGQQPTINMNNGATLGLSTDSTRTVTDSGAAFHQDKPRRRSLRFSISELPEAEALGTLGPFNMQRIAGTSTQMFVVYDPDDTVLLRQFRSFLGTLRELSAVEFAYRRGSLAFAVDEVL